VKRRALWAALAVLAVAVALRLHGLSQWPLDGDEFYTHEDVQRILSGEAWPQGVRSHPLGYLGSAAGVALLGEGEGPLRLFAALTGTLAVAALLTLRRDAVPSSAALAAGVLAALSPWLLFHSQEARFYGPLLLCASLATLWALPGPGRRPILAALAALAAALCHPSAWMLPPCLLLPALASGPGRARALLLFGVALAALAAWLLLADGAAPNAVRHALGRRGPASYDVPHFVGGIGYSVGIGIGLLALAGSAAMLRERTEGGTQLLLAAWAPSALLLLAGLAGVSVQQRYALVSMPALLLLAGRALLPLATRPAGFATALALAVLPSMPALLDTVATGDRSDVRAAAAWLGANARPEDVVVADEHATLDIYLRREPGFADKEDSHEAPPPALRMWTLLRTANDCWVVVKRSRLPDAYGEEFSSWLAQGFVERARIGRPPPPLVRHDNVLLIFQRRERLPPGTPPQAHGSPTEPPR
jgi:mannosyltransferase